MSDGHHTSLSIGQERAIFTRLEGRLTNVLSVRAAAVAKGDSDGAWGLTWHRENREFKGLTAHRYANHAGRLFLADKPVQAHRIHVGVRHGHVVVPRDFGQRIGRFLQHGIRRMLAGSHGGLFVQGQLKGSALLGIQRGNGTGQCTPCVGRCSLLSGIQSDKTVVNRCVPVRVGVHGIGGVARLVGLAQEGVPVGRLT